jgi:murein DD-endopeptidase MepM/ murein hydrolase activator NlpD
MRRLLAPLLVVAVLVAAQGAIVLASGAPSLASPRPEGPASGAGGAGPALGPGTDVDVVADGRLDGSAGIAHLASVSAARAVTAQAADQGSMSTTRRAQREGPAYSYPVTWGTPISGTFGEVSPSWPRGHAGMDFNGETGDPVYAATDGRVQYAEFNYGGYGNLVMIMRPDGTQTRYAHLDRIKVKKGDRVSAGDLIGTIGNTGDSSGSHLHFEVRSGKALTPTNPAGLWTGPRPGVPAKPPAWACRNYGC